MQAAKIGTGRNNCVNEFSQALPAHAIELLNCCLQLPAHSDKNQQKEMAAALRDLPAKAFPDLPATCVKCRARDTHTISNAINADNLSTWHMPHIGAHLLIERSASKQACFPSREGPATNLTTHCNNFEEPRWKANATS